MTTITTWIYAKLEYISGTLCGLSVIPSINLSIATPPDIIAILLKIVMAIVLGAAGGLGSHLVKLLLNKLTKKKSK